MHEVIKYFNSLHRKCIRIYYIAFYLMLLYYNNFISTLGITNVTATCVDKKEGISVQLHFIEQNRLFRFIVL